MYMSRTVNFYNPSVESVEGGGWKCGGSTCGGGVGELDGASVQQEVCKVLEFLIYVSGYIYIHVYEFLMYLCVHIYIYICGYIHVWMNIYV